MSDYIVEFQSLSCNTPTPIMGFDLYEKILRNKIDLVCKRIHFTPSTVKWIIFDSSERKRDLKGNVLVGTRGSDYGFCFPKRKEIWISTLALQKSNFNKKTESLQRQVFNTLMYNRTSDYLADVLIDEITHIQTGKDHEDLKYKETFTKNRKMFYETSVIG